VGPDGNLWFSEQGSFALDSGGQIGQITPAGAVTEFPLAPGYGVGNTSALTVGPDKDLYFTLSSGYLSEPLTGTGTPAAFSIGRITTSGNVIEFTGTVPLSSASPSAFAPTVGSDGNLWFPDGSNIGRLDRALATLDQALPPGVHGGGPTYNGKFSSFTAITLEFDEAMNSTSGSTASFYRVATGFNTRRRSVFTKVVKIRSVTYDPSTGTVTLRLAKPYNINSEFRVTVRAGIMAANGVSTVGNATELIVP
jgi:hypothetical protein